MSDTEQKLASLYAKQGKYAQAELLYQRALSIWEHREVTSSSNDLVDVWCSSLTGFESHLLHHSPELASGLDRSKQRRLTGCDG